jgi:hypothetical protein
MTVPSDQSATVWTDWFGTAPWFIAGVVATIAVMEIVQRRRMRRVKSYRDWLQALRSVTPKRDNTSIGGNANEKHNR